jgi:predicted RNA binding protein YcfA (HicA-like mRNA interferase family)
MTKTPVVRSRDCVRALQRLGFRIRRQTGSHAILRRDARPRWTVVVPMHDELSRGTLKSILEQAHLKLEQLLEAM